MDITAQQIADYVTGVSYRPLKPRELAKALKISEADYRDFRILVRELVNAGELVRIRGGRIGPPEQMDLKVGRINITSQGYAFLKPEGETEELFISAPDTRMALNGDKVVVRVKDKRRGRKSEAEVVRVLERANPMVVGTYHKTKFFEYVEPDDRSFKRNVYLLPNHELAPKNGQKVAVLMSEWKNEYLNPEWKLVEILGFPDESGVDILTVIKKFNLPTAFPPEVEHEAHQTAQTLTDRDLEHRLDLRDRVAFTIDPVDAKDHDDAVSVEVDAEGNYILGVHIADVSHYVAEGTPLDKEAANRGTSVYLVDRVLPMLPERLSNQICSLRADEDRLTYTCEIVISPRGAVKDYRIFKSVIRSRAKLSYDRVQELFDAGRREGLAPEVTESLSILRRLAKLLRQKRLARGSLDFDLPEPLVVLDDSGDVVDIRPRPRKESHRLIEEFMLLANTCVAKHFTHLGLPTLYRVHDVPDPEKMEALREFAKSFGYTLKLTEPVQPMQLSEFLNELEGKPEEELLNEVLLRSLKKAQYQRENIGHFGLALHHYLHFTSPIRRYPDLLVHRLLSEINHGHYPGRRLGTINAFLDRVGTHSSEMEVLAEKAERETVRIKQVVYLSKHVGDVFEGIISGITSGGFFVRLIKFSAEGMVRLSLMTDDYYHVDKDRYLIVGRHTKKRYRLGDTVYVQILAVDLELSRVDLRLVEEERKPSAASPAGRAAKSRRKRK